MAESERNKSKAPSTLSNLIFIGLGALAGWAITSLYEEEKQKEKASTNIAPKTMDYTNKCVICLDNFKEADKVTTLICAHQFHLECFKNVKKKECPICRTSY